MKNEMYRSDIMWKMEMDAGSHQCKDVYQLIGVKQQEDKAEIDGYIPWLNENTIINVPIKNVQIKSELEHNILSLKVIMEKGFNIKYHVEACEIYRNNVLILSGVRRNEHYIVKTSFKEDTPRNNSDVQVNIIPNMIKEDLGGETYISRESQQEGMIDECCGAKGREFEKHNEIRNRGTVSNLRVELIDEDGIEIVFDAAAAVSIVLRVDWLTSPLIETEINVSNDDCCFNKYKDDSLIDTMYMNSLSPHIECESLGAHESFEVSKHFNDNGAFRGSTRATTQSFNHKHHIQPKDRLASLRSSMLSQEHTLYRDQLHNITSMAKIKGKRNKRDSKIVRTCIHDTKLKPDEGPDKSDAVLITKPLLNVDVTTFSLCKNSKHTQIYPSYGRTISLVNECPEDRLEFFKVLIYILRISNSAKQQFVNNYNRQRSTEEQIWQNHLGDIVWLFIQVWCVCQTLDEHDQFLCIQRQARGNGILKVIMQLHLKSTIKCKLKIGGTSTMGPRTYSDADWGRATSTQKFVSGQIMFLGDILMNWKARKQKDDIQYILWGSIEIKIIL